MTLSIHGSPAEHDDLQAKVEKRFVLIKFGKAAGFPTRSLITTTRELHKWLLAAPSVWRAEPSSFGIPAPNQIFGYLAKEAGFEALLIPFATGRASVSRCV